MKCYTTDKELEKLIEEMSSQRQIQDSWDESDEQILSFLKELVVRRVSDSWVKANMKTTDNLISYTNDKM